MTTSEMAQRIYGDKPRPWQLDLTRKSVAKFAERIGQDAAGAGRCFGS